MAYFFVLIVYLLCGRIALGQELLEKSHNDIIFEVNARNNLSGLDSFYPSIDKDKLYLIDEIPESALALLSVDLQAPLLVTNSYEYGLSFQQKNWYKMTGETIDFYQEITKDEPVLFWKYYNLGYDDEIYRRLGVYAYKKEPITQGLIILRSDFFIIPEYRKTEIIGRGKLSTDINSAKQTELYGNYKKGSINQIGWGGGLSCKTDYSLNSGIKISLTMNNLVSIAYFPSYTLENGSVDSSKNVLSPVYMAGFRKKETVWSRLPLEVVGRFYYPVSTGRYGLSIVKIEEYHDYYFEYIHSINYRDSVVLRVDPVMRSLDLGYLWHNGKIVFSLSPYCDWKITGLGISLFY